MEKTLVYAFCRDLQRLQIPRCARMSLPSVVILSAVRTPLGAFNGALAKVPAPALGAAAVRGALAKAEVDAGRVTDVILGNVLAAGAGQAPARQAALGAGLSPAVHTAGVSKVCGSGLWAIALGVQGLQVGEADVVVAGGMESMSRAPYLLERTAGKGLGHRQLQDSMLTDGLWCSFSQQAMGECAEACASEYGISRPEQDDYALASFDRALTAAGEGHSAAEIVPIDGISADEGLGRLKRDRVRQLSPVFRPDGTITAANASSISDGAAALVLCRDATAQEAGWRPQARIVAIGSWAEEPLWFTRAPIGAARAALRRAGWTAADVDLWEVNEAFAVVPLLFIRQMNVDPQRVNVFGGAIAIGHPLGASGARIVATLLNALRVRGLTRGVAVICIGGGEALAICVETENGASRG
jgi:acetyl-CoA C-acetyltransferase